MNWEVLSRRERQIVDLITGEQCMTSGQIGEVLGISPRTIESHRFRIFKKLNVKNMVELTRLVLSEGEFDMLSHLRRQREWSERTFGPGTRSQGVVNHIRKELIEIETEPGDLVEWIDVVILALDGAWRTGATPRQIITALIAKQAKNENRQWPDWRTAEPDNTSVPTMGRAPFAAVYRGS